LHLRLEEWSEASKTVEEKVLLAGNNRARCRA